MSSVHSKGYQEFLRKLRKARLDAGLTQHDVAKKLKKPQSYVSKFECGERRLDVMEARDVAAICGKKLSDLTD